MLLKYSIVCAAESSHLFTTMVKIKSLVEEIILDGSKRIVKSSYKNIKILFNGIFLLKFIHLK